MKGDAHERRDRVAKTYLLTCAFPGTCEGSVLPTAQLYPFQSIQLPAVALTSGNGGAKGGGVLRAAGGVA